MRITAFMQQQKVSPVDSLLNSNVVKNTWWHSFKHKNWKPKLYVHNLYLPQSVTGGKPLSFCKFQSRTRSKLFSHLPRNIRLTTQSGRLFLQMLWNLSVDCNYALLLYPQSVTVGDNNSTFSPNTCDTWSQECTLISLIQFDWALLCSSSSYMSIYLHGCEEWVRRPLRYFVLSRQMLSHFFFKAPAYSSALYSKKDIALSWRKWGLVVRLNSLLKEIVYIIKYIAVLYCLL